MKNQLKETKETAEEQESIIKELQSKLQSDELSKTLCDVTGEKEMMEKLCEELEIKLKAHEEEVERLEAELSRKTQYLNQKEQELHHMREALEQSEQHIFDLERDLEHLEDLRKQVKVSAEKIADLEEELSAVRSQLSEQDQELAVKDDVHRAELLQLEKQYNLEKSKLNKHMEELEKELERTRRQSTMSDSLNSNMADILREKDETIAQLEERLIENDTKISELSDEIGIEIDENTQLQESLNSSYNESARIKHDLELANAEVQRMEEALAEATSGASVLKTAEQEQRVEVNQAREEQLRFKEQVDALQQENEELRHALEELTRDSRDDHQLEDLTRECEEHRSQNKALKEECTRLEDDISNTNLKLDQYEAQLKDQKSFFEKDLEKRHEELVEAQKIALDLQTKLQSAEASANENKMLIDEQMAAVQPFQGQPDVQEQKKRLEEDYGELKVKYDRSVSEVKRLRGEIREAHISIDDMEIASTSLKQQFRAMETDYQRQISMMTERVQDLTSKLAAADKKVRKLEKRASRRESRSKQRSESQDAEKTSGSSGEAEPEQVPDQEVLDVLKAVIGDGPTEAIPTSALDTSTSSKLDESINSTATEVSEADILSLADPEVAAKFRKLQEALSKSDTKVKELTHQLELTTPEGQNKALADYQKRNKEYEQQIIFLTAKLNRTSAKESVEVAKAKRAASRDSSIDQEDDVSGSNTTLEDMQQKLSGVVQELDSLSAVKTDNYTSTIEKLKSKLETILKETEAGERDIGSLGALKQPAMKLEQFALKLNDPEQVFAEKLSIEAILIGEMAHLIKTGQDQMMSEREVYLHEIAEANHRILELEHKVQALQLSDGTKGAAEPPVTGESLLRSSGLLAEKMVLQGQIQLLLDKYQKQEEAIQATQGREKGEASAHNMGQEALFKSRLTERLQDSSQNYAMSLASHVLVQGELTVVLNKLRERMADSRTDQERIELLDHELELSHQRLCERANLMCDGVEAYKLSALDRVAVTILNNKANKDQVDEQVALMIKNCAAEYRKCSVDGEHLGVMTESIPESRRHAMIEASIQQEIEETTELIAERCEMSQTVESVASESELESVLLSVCEVLAQKAVIDGHIAYITEQIQQHQQQAPTGDGRTPNPLRRHDSGIIVGGGSLPTSPTAEEMSPDSSTDGESSSLASRLAHEAAAKRQLAASLQQKNPSRPDSLQGQMAKIAARLVNVDIDLIKHRRLISDYAEVIAQEAMFQAQMSYLINKLKLEHEREVKELQRQVDTKSPQSTVDDEHVKMLELEIQRLSQLLSDNDDLLQKEAGAAQDRMAQLEEQLQRQEDFFQNKIKSLEERYKSNLQVTDQDLQQTKEQLESHQLNRDEEVNSLKGEIEELKGNLSAAQEALQVARSEEEDASVSNKEEKVKEVEEQLDAAHDLLAKIQEEREKEVHMYEEQIAELESQILSVR